jgi:hypothetical protein
MILEDQNSNKKRMTRAINESSLSESGCPSSAHLKISQARA